MRVEIQVKPLVTRVLEEREKERRKEQKFCIDIGTQTHGWSFPDGVEILQQVSPAVGWVPGKWTDGRMA